MWTLLASVPPLDERSFLYRRGGGRDSCGSGSDARQALVTALIIFKNESSSPPDGDGTKKLARMYCKQKIQ